MPKFNQCPKSMLRGFIPAYIMPYARAYLDSGVFPDGRGMLFQPVSLINTLNAFVSVFRMFEQEEMKRLSNVK